MNQSERVVWLQQNSGLGSLSEPVLSAIAAAIHEIPFQENQRLVLEETLPPALYILYNGHIERERADQNKASTPATGLLPGAVMYLKELLLNRVAEHTAIALSDGVVWTIDRDTFCHLAQTYPEIGRSVSQQLASELEAVSSELAFERERQAVLRPYLVPKVRRGIVGSSRYAVRLRQEISKASSDRGSVLIFGEPGLEKDNAAALIHFGSRDRKEPMIKVNCNEIQSNGAELFGRTGKPGLLDWLGRGTLLLNNLEDASPELEAQLVRLLQTGTYLPIRREGEPPPEARSVEGRLMFTSEKISPQVERAKCITHVIKMPPLRVRKADIALKAQYYLTLLSRSRGIPKPKITPEALRRLQGYDFPGNTTELRSLVERALAQSGGANELTEEVFWAADSKNRRFRVNLLNASPPLRQFLRSPWWTDRLNFGFTSWVFALVVVVLMWGPQSRDQNIALNLFWAWWWILVLIGFPFVGRLWCAVCPFMIYGEMVQKLSLWIYPRRLRPWARQPAEKWGGWFVFGLFALILLWEELWNLENTAYLSGCLLLLITAGAVTFSLLFERRFWCRYLCPIGGMNGLFAKLSMVELRAQQGICSASCNTYQCYKGGPEKGEGLETGGCPVYSHPAQLQDNRDCVLCMTCLKACPHRSVELNLRPPGVELWTTHKPSYAEVSLLFLLWGAVLLHRLPELERLLGRNLHLDQFGSHAGAATIALMLPGAIALAAHGLLTGINHLRHGKTRPFVELAYGYLPLVLGSSIAHYLHLGLTEAGRVIPVAIATFDPAASIAALPVAIADPAVIAFLQATTIIVSFWLSVLLIQKIARQFTLSLLPYYGAMVGIGSVVWKLTVGV